MVDLQPHPALRPQRAAVQGPEMGRVSFHGADSFPPGSTDRTALPP